MTASKEAFENVSEPEVAQRFAVNAGVCSSSTQCSICGLREACLPCDLMLSDGGQIQPPIANDRYVGRGASLYRAGDEFTHLYTVRSGSFKAVQRIKVGLEQVTGFQISGDLLGADGIASEAHSCDAIALEDSHVCAIAYAQAMNLGRSKQGLRQRIEKSMSDQIVREQDVMLLLGSKRAEERIASFLLKLSERLAVRGYSPVEFIFRMSRYDIASYLGMSNETVSRMFATLQEAGVIRVSKKHVHIRDIASLRRRMSRNPDEGTRRQVRTLSETR